MLAVHRVAMGTLLALALVFPAGAAGASRCEGRGPALQNGPLIVDRTAQPSKKPTTTGLYTVSQSGRGLRRLTTQRRGFSDGRRFVAASPDGRFVSYVHSGPVPGATATVEVVSLRTRRFRTLTTAARPLTSSPPTWSADGRWIAFPGYDVDTLLVRPNGTGARQLPVTGGRFFASHFSPNGRCLVGRAVGETGPNDVAIIGAAGGEFTRVPAVQERFGWTRPSGEPRGAGALRFTPDGRRIAFLADSSNGSVAAYSIKLDGTGLREIATVRSVDDAPVFSPDGRLVAYGDRRGTMVRKVSGGPARRLLKGSWIKAWAPRPR